MRLTIRRETLTPLTDDGLASVQGGTSIQEFRRITSRCPTLLVGECTTLPPVPMETQYCGG